MVHATKNPCFLTNGHATEAADAPTNIAIDFYATEVANLKKAVVMVHSLLDTNTTMSLNGGALVAAVPDMLRHDSRMANLYEQVREPMGTTGTTVKLTYEDYLDFLEIATDPMRQGSPYSG
jgi:hypothetical protein